MRLKSRLASFHYGTAALTVALPALTYGAITDTRGPTAIGIIGSLMACQLFHCHRMSKIIRDTHGPSRVMFERGKDMGYQQGWRDGHKAARPVLVPLRPGSDGAQQSDFLSS